MSSELIVYYSLCANFECTNFKCKNELMMNDKSNVVVGVVNWGLQIGSAALAEGL